MQSMIAALSGNSQVCVANQWDTPFGFFVQDYYNAGDVLYCNHEGLITNDPELRGFPTVGLVIEPPAPATDNQMILQITYSTIDNKKMNEFKRIYTSPENNETSPEKLKENDFLKHILGHREAWISDESSIYDFDMDTHELKKN